MTACLGITSSERTLLYGAGWAGVMVARSAERSPDSGVAPVGFLDDDADLKGRRVDGLTVYGGRQGMGRAKRLTGATTSSSPCHERREPASGGS